MPHSPRRRHRDLHHSDCQHHKDEKDKEDKEDSDSDNKSNKTDKSQKDKCSSKSGTQSPLRSPLRSPFISSLFSPSPSTTPSADKNQEKYLHDPIRNTKHPDHLGEFLDPIYQHQGSSICSSPDITNTGA
ncbi:hypothetical protein INT45_006064 [Circinella minor]|uniref:Uncharacterized protein n=1 Tax=Circinella minor TaxID=1195481 RepID=A0A8H7VH35_9FUNG|nr:hypothetical protein INT45_006064 [Circinella minor]